MVWGKAGAITKGDNEFRVLFFSYNIITMSVCHLKIRKDWIIQHDK